MSANKMTRLQKVQAKLAARSTKIVDAACAKVDKKIEVLQQQIAELESEKQAIRNSAPQAPSFDEPEAA